MSVRVFFVIISAVFVFSAPTLFADPNLVGHWKLDEGGGSIAGDSSGNGNDGTRYGAVWTIGRISGALDFDGRDDYVDVGNDSSLNPSQITVSLWFKSYDDTRSIITKGGSRRSNSERDWDIFGNGTELKWLGSNGTGSIWVASTTYPSIGEWHHVVGTWDGTTDPNGSKLYLDGELVDNVTASGTNLATTHNIYIGGRVSSGDYEFDGRIDDVRIYSKVLSIEQIQELYNDVFSKAYNPIPDNVATDVDPNVVLSWRPGGNSASHDVYFGTDFNDVNVADTNSPEYKGNFDVNYWDPCGLDLLTSYYWRVDEVNDANLWKGNVWTFKTSDADERLNVPSEYSTIQAAINDANDGDTIIVAPGTYNGDGNRDINFLGKAIILQSINPNDPCVVAATVIDCNGSPNEPHHGFYFHNSEDANSILAGLTITNGYAKRGGGIRLEEASPTIAKCVIAGNTATSFGGGGVYCKDSSPTFTNCIFTNNSATTAGGGMYNTSAYVSKPVVVRNCIFSRNSAEYYGGGMYNTTISTLVENCIFERNTASYYGGGILESYDSNSIITGCTIIANSAWSGGAMYIIESDPTITNCIIWLNSPEISTSDSNAVISYSNVRGYVWPGPGNISVNPQFANLGLGDLHLLPASPCIDAGDPNYVAEPNETDFYGESRIIGGRVDIGADELGKCMSQTNPDYANWQYWGEPNCWCYSRQCRGDADGEKLGPFWVSGNDLTILRAAISKLEQDLPLGGICADLNHQKLGPFWVSGNDLAILRLYISKLEEDVPVCADPPDENYNFWLTP